MGGAKKPPLPFPLWGAFRRVLRRTVPSAHSAAVGVPLGGRPKVRHSCGRMFLFAAMASLGWGVASGGQMETFSEMPLGAKWETAAREWTGDSGMEVSACLARLDAVWEGNPAIAIRSNGWVSVTLTNRSLQRVRVVFRQALSGRPSDCELWVNGQKAGGYKSTGDTDVVDSVEWETVDPATGYPFVAGDGGLTVTISNRLKSAAAVALDNLEWEEWNLFVKLDKPGTNTVTAADEEFEGGEFDIAAGVSDSAGELAGEGIEGFWSVDPPLKGGATGMDGRMLTVTPTLEDVGNVYALTYTAIREVATGDGVSADGEAGMEEQAVRRITNSATAWMEVVEPAVYRWIDFEDADDFSKATEGVSKPVLLSGGIWNVHGAHRAGAGSPKIGNYAIGLVHASSTRPGWMESGFAYPRGIGTLSMRYANLNTNNAQITMVVQTKSVEDETWTTVEGGEFTAEAHYQMTDEEFRVDIQEERDRMVRIMTAPHVSANAGMRVTLDNIHIRPFGETAPVLAWEGPSLIPSGDEWPAWRGRFVYAHAETEDHEWAWEAAEPLAHCLQCTTNGNQLEFALCEPVPAWTTNRLTAQVLIDGKTDQRKHVDLAVFSPPEFELATPMTIIRLAETNVVDVRVTNVVLHGPGTNWTLQWTATPPFSGTNTFNRKNRYIVRELDQTENSEHLLTASLKETSTQLTTEKSLLFLVLAEETPEPGTEAPEIREILDGALTVGGIRSGHVYRVFSVEGLEAGVSREQWIWESEAIQAGTNDLLRLPMDTNHPPICFFGVIEETP